MLGTVSGEYLEALPDLVQQTRCPKYHRDGEDEGEVQSYGAPPRGIRVSQVNFSFMLRNGRWLRFKWGTMGKQPQPNTRLPGGWSPPEGSC